MTLLITRFPYYNIQSVFTSQEFNNYEFVKFTKITSFIYNIYYDKIDSLYYQGYASSIQYQYDRLTTYFEEMSKLVNFFWVHYKNFDDRFFLKFMKCKIRKNN